MARSHLKRIQCSKCGVTKSRADFYFRPNGRLLWAKYKICVRARVATRGRARHAELRLAALKRYGGDPPCCACCGEHRLEFLHIDHADKSGANHRKELGSLNLYRWLAQHNYPDMPLRVLCANCNLAIDAYGYCPHERERTAAGLA